MTCVFGGQVGYEPMPTVGFCDFFCFCGLLRPVASACNFYFCLKKKYRSVSPLGSFSSFAKSCKTTGGRQKVAVCHVSCEVINPKFLTQ